MTNNPNKETQYLILDSLANGAKYGLEVIEYIAKKTDGNYILKKPTLYSCLSRMEKKGLISSSYWGESDLGGKRHYYNITKDGKRSLEELSAEYANSNFKNIENSSDTLNRGFLNVNVSTEEVAENENKGTMFLQQDNIFNLVKEKSESDDKNSQTAKNGQTGQNNQALDNQIDFFSFEKENKAEENSLNNTANFIESITAQKQQTYQQEENAQYQENRTENHVEKMEYYQSKLEQSSPSDNGIFLDENEHLTPAQEEQNKRLYDTSNELKRYRKRKSFSENQIEMAVVYENEEDHEIQRQRIEQLKASMLSARQNHFENTEVTNYDNEPQRLQSYQTIASSRQAENTKQADYPYHRKSAFYAEETNQNDEMQDDGVFINMRYKDNEIPIQKKIAPPNIEVSIDEGNLPAPKRNSKLEPTYKDMMSKLFERKKEEQISRESQNYVPQPIQPEPQEDVGSFADYNSLKRYYRGHDIEFKEYSASNVERSHNTNQLNLIASIALLLFSGIGSAILFGIISGIGKLNASSNWLFYTVPILFLIYVIFTFIRTKVNISKKAVLTYSGLVNWAVFVLGAIIVMIANVIIGMQFETMSDYITSLLLPTFALLLAFPVNFYIKKLLYKKFAK